MSAYALVYRFNDGDPQAFPNAPASLSKVDANDALRELRTRCKRAGYAVKLTDLQGNFTARKGSRCVAVWMQPVNDVETEGEVA